MTTLELVATLVGRAQRADARSVDLSLPKNQRDFHAGRREAYLQCVALLADSKVKNIRDGVLGSTR
jgi:hypothetical protein